MQEYPNNLAYEKGGDRGHLYVISQEDVSNSFKVGRTTNLFSRLSYYPTNIKLEFCIECPHNLRNFEQYVILKIHGTSMYKLINGRETFEGCVKKCIFSIIQWYADYYESVKHSSPPLENISNCNTLEDILTALHTTTLSKNTIISYVGILKRMTSNIPLSTPIVDILNDTNHFTTFISTKKNITTQQSYWNTLNTIIRLFNIPVSNDALTIYSNRILHSSID